MTRCGSRGGMGSCGCKNAVQNVHRSQQAGMVLVVTPCVNGCHVHGYWSLHMPATSCPFPTQTPAQVVEGLAKKRGERFAFDCYRRLLDMFGDVVLGIEHEKFEEHIHAVKVRGRAGAHSWHSLLFNISWGWSWVRNARRPPCHPICAC